MMDPIQKLDKQNNYFQQDNGFSQNFLKSFQESQDFYQSSQIILKQNHEKKEPKKEFKSQKYELYRLLKEKKELIRQQNNQKKEMMKQKILKYNQDFQIKSKQIQLELLNKQKQDLKQQMENISEKYEQQINLISLGSEKRDGLKQKLYQLQEENQIDESLLLSQRSELRILQAKKIIMAYNLYNLSYTFENYSVSQFLESHTISNVVIAEDENVNKSREKNIWKINNKQQHQNLFSYEHKQVINYAFQNLVKFVEYVIRVKNFEIPFYFYLDYHNLPNLQLPQYNDDLVHIHNANSQIEKEVYQLFNENLNPVYENFVYCWINYQILYKRLGMDFKKLVLDEKLIFPVYQLKEFFINELDNIKQQLPSLEYQYIVYNNQLINSDLLQIKYHKNSLKIISEEIIIFRDNPNLQIINIHDNNLESKISEMEHDNSDSERSFEFIEYGQYSQQ